MGQITRRSRRWLVWSLGIVSVMTATVALLAWQVPERVGPGSSDAALEISVSPVNPENWATYYGEDAVLRLSEERSVWQELGAPRELTVEIMFRFTRHKTGAPESELDWQVSTSQTVSSLPDSTTRGVDDDGRSHYSVDSWEPLGNKEARSGRFPVHIEDDPDNDGFEFVELYMAFRTFAPIVSQGVDDGVPVQSLRVAWSPPTTGAPDWRPLVDSDGDGLPDDYADEDSAKLSVVLCDSCDVQAVFAEEPASTPVRGSQVWQIPVTRHESFEFTTSWRPWAWLHEISGWLLLTTLGAAIALIIEGILVAIRATHLSRTTAPEAPPSAQQRPPKVAQPPRHQSGQRRRRKRRTR